MSIEATGGLCHQVGQCWCKEFHDIPADGRGVVTLHVRTVKPEEVPPSAFSRKDES